MEVLEKVKLEHLEEEARALAELIGIENFKKLVRIYGGASIYIPKMDSISKEARNEQIREEFTGDNLHELALKYHLTDKWVRDIIAGENGEIDLPGQMSLFDYDDDFREVNL